MTLKLSAAQRNKSETKQFRNCFETCFVSVSFVARTV